MLPESRINGLRLHIPPSLAGIVPVSPCGTDYPYEIHSWVALEMLAGAGTVVYDLGSAHGLIAAMLALLGSEVHAFEANPQVVPLARELWSANRLDIRLTEACVGEADGGDIDFYCAPGGAMVASSRHPVVERIHPEARAVRVPVVSLDGYVRRTSRRPQVLKVDIEGSEWLALQGAVELLSRKPDLVIETHPRQILGDGASLERMVCELEQLGYRLLDLLSAEPMGAIEFAARYQHEAGYLLASTRLLDLQFEQQLIARHRAMKVRWADQERHAATIGEARALMERSPAEALLLLDSVLTENPTHAEANYLRAWCLHSGHIDAGEAERHYRRALEHGFDPFWVHYNLGALLFDQGRIDDALPHLETAACAQPNHEGVRFYLDQITTREGPRRS